MQLTCSRCPRVLEYAEVRPSFCAYCGSALVETRVEPGQEDRAAAPTPCRLPGQASPNPRSAYRVLRASERLALFWDSHGTDGMSVVDGWEQVTSRIATTSSPLFPVARR